jgi:hypothetical protein
MEYLYCLSDNKVARGQDWCDLTFPSNEADMSDCYSEYDVKSIKACDFKYNFTSDSIYQSDEGVQQCYTDAGFTLDQNFCDDNYEDVDAKYSCFVRIGLSITKDRTYCELKNRKDRLNKYTCISDELTDVKEGGDYCYYSNRWPKDYEDRFTCLAD